MKSGSYVTLMILPMLALLAIGCGGESAKTDATSGEKVAETKEKTGNAGEEAINNAEAAFESLKGEYVSKAQGLVSSWKDKLTDLDGKKTSLPELAQKPLEEPFKTVMDKNDELKDGLGDLKSAGEDTFDEKKAAFEKVTGELESSYESMLGMFE
jgi:hypothetical protein